MAYTKEQRRKYDRMWRVKNREKIRAWCRLWRAKNKDKIQIYNLRRKRCKEKYAETHAKQHEIARLKWIAKHKEEKEQKKKVLCREMAKKIPKIKCEMCHKTEKLHRHHPNYEKPLDVVVLCRDCHGEEHRRINRHIASELETKRD
jgi:hypothetical protein